MKNKQRGPAFAQEGDFIFIILIFKQTNPQLQKKTLSLSSKAVCYTYITEKNNLEQKLLEL